MTANLLGDLRLTVAFSMSTDTELRIAFDALEALFSAFGKNVDVNVNITTPGGTVTVKCRLVNDTVAG